MDARDRLNEALVDRYRLEEEIGRGGMAIVYRARDLRHERDVALKVLRPQVAAAVGPSRFLREVELAAGLTHPSILPVFDSGQVDNLLYYVMPFVDGETVQDRIEREGALPLMETLRIVREVADGLDFAHRQGVVHRDVKPGNVLLTEGHSYIADFGIALPIGPEAEEHLTRTGLAIGTPAYMSPEQASGERTIDGRSDIYGLGCVMYEMLSGSLPFDGPTPQSILVRRLTDDAAPIRTLRRDVPPNIERALIRAMARDPNDRFDTAADFEGALAPEAGVGQSLASIGRRLGHQARARFRPHPVAVPIAAMLVVGTLATLAWMFGPGRPSTSETASTGLDSGAPTSVSVAVLLPRTPTGDDDLPGYGEALTDELIHRLGAIEGLETRSLRAVLPYLQANTPPDSIGRALGVDYLVESSLLGSTDSLRFNLSLVEAATGAVLDESRHEAAKSQVLPLVDSVTNEVTFSLRQQLGREFRVLELRAQTEDEEAWLLVREAETERRRAVDAASEGGENRNRAIRLLDRSDSLLAVAAARDSDWAEPHIQAGWNHLERALAKGEEARVYDSEDEPLLTAAVQASGDALTRDSLSAEAMALRGTALHALSNLDRVPESRDRLDLEAELWLERAVAIDAEQIEALRELASHARFHQGDSERSLELLSRAYEADRWLVDADVLVSAIAELSTDIGDYATASIRVQEGRRRWPDNVEFPALALMVLAGAGTDIEAAWAMGDTVLDLYAIDRTDPSRSLIEAQVASVITRAGLQDSALAVLERAETTARGADLEYLVAYDLAHSWLVYGDTVRALDWLELNLEDEPEKRAMRASEPYFQPLHGNPRFQQLVAEPSASN
jgi:TolB-like protein